LFRLISYDRLTIDLHASLEATWMGLKIELASGVIF
jgi:hypothetical protein